MKEKIIATDKKNLISLIAEEVKLYGQKCDLNHIDISKVIDISFLFSNYNSNFNGDISCWDVSKVINMSYLFYNSQFNGDISNWDLSNANNMTCLFYKSQFNGDVSSWRPLKVQNITNMFLNCEALIPYWFSENNKIIVKKIESYDLFKKMDIELNGTENKIKSSIKTNKIKI